MSTPANFIALPNVLGDSPATMTTVQLFNSVREIKKDQKGKYMITAVSPYLNGVLTEKQYI